MKTDKKLKKAIILLLIIGFILIGIILIIINIKQNTLVDDRYTEKDVEIINQEIESYLSDKITPKGLSKLYGRYNGDNELNDLYRKLYLFVYNLPSLYNDVIKLDNLNEYFEKNKANIKNNFGITNIENFEKIVTYIKNTGYSGQDFIDCQIIDDTFNEINNYFVFNLKFNFKDFNNEFVLRVNFANSKTETPMVFYSILTENTNIE